MRRNRSDHMVQSLFLITLLGLFFICAIGVIAMGASVYQKTAKESSIDYQIRTSLSYISEKARQSDQEGGLYVGTLADGTEALILPATYNETAYRTYIYAYEGTLRELFVKADSQTAAPSGTEIMEIRALTLEPVASTTQGTSPGTLVRVSVTDTDGHTASVLLGSHAQEEVGV